MALTGKRGQFPPEYLKDLNATKAAIRSGFSKKTAYSAGHRLLKDVEIADEIQRLMDLRAENTKITQEMVVNELAKIGFSDVRKLVGKDGEMIPVDKWDDETAGAVSSLEVKSAGDNHSVHKLKLWDKQSALVNIGKHLGMFSDKVEIGGPDGEPLVSDKQLARVFAFVAARVKSGG